MSVRKPQMRDDVTLTLIGNNEDVLWSKVLAGKENVNMTETVTPPLSAGDTLFVSAKVESRVPLDWENLDWTIKPISSFDGETTTMHIAPEIGRMYNNVVSVASAKAMSDSEKPVYDFKVEETDSIFVDAAWQKTGSALANAIYDNELKVVPYLDGVRFSSDTIKTSKFAFSLTSVADKEVELADTTAGYIRNAKADSVCLSLDVSNIGKELLADFYIDEETESVGNAEMHIGQWVTLVYTDTYLDTAKVKHAFAARSADTCRSTS